jgi:hypothetical protein
VSTSERIAFLRKAYRRFNDRQIDGLLQMMTDGVEWPAQFSAGDPHVDPVDFIESGDDLVVVVDQRVADREGRPLPVPPVVFHRYTFDGDLVRRMVVFTDRDAAITDLDGPGT